MGFQGDVDAVEGVAIIRRRQGYATVPNTAISDTRLTIEARGLLVYLASHSDVWRFRTSQIAQACGVGRDKLHRMMGELREFGYLSIHPIRGDRGRISHHEWAVDLEPSTPLKTRALDDAGSGFYPPHKNTNLKPPSEEQEKEPPVASQPGLFSAVPSEEKNAEKGKPPRPVPAQAKEDPSAAEFDRFWAAYPSGPRKTDKPKARALFAAIVAGKHKGIAKTDPEVIIAGVEAWASSKRDAAYDPMPTTWLNGARWEQHAPEPKKDYRPLVVDLMATYYVELGKISGKATISGEGKRAAETATMFRDAERWSDAEWEAMKTEAQRRAAGQPQANQATG